MLARTLGLRALAAPWSPLLWLLVAACTPSPPSPTASSTASGTGAAAGGPPDFSGVWMAFAVENPDGGGNAPRYSDAGRAALDAFAAQFSEIPETGAACVGTGMPSVMLSTVS